jgi:hypothetical protein
VVCRNTCVLASRAAAVVKRKEALLNIGKKEEKRRRAKFTMHLMCLNIRVWGSFLLHTRVPFVQVVVNWILSCKTGQHLETRVS